MDQSNSFKIFLFVKHLCYQRNEFVKQLVEFLILHEQYIRNLKGKFTQSHESLTGNLTFEKRKIEYKDFFSKRYEMIFEKKKCFLYKIYGTPKICYQAADFLQWSEWLFQELKGVLAYITHYNFMSYRFSEARQIINCNLFKPFQ